MPTPRLKPESTAVLLVDVQECLTPLIHEHERLIEQAGKLLDAAAALDLPVLVTEQYRKGLGETVGPLRERAAQARCCHEKLKFSACVPPILDELASLDARSVLVAGIEAHICVLQTCMDLLDAGYMAAVAVDAIGSRRVVDRDAAVQRMIQAGVIPTTVESAIMELVCEAGTDQFKAILPIIKS